MHSLVLLMPCKKQLKMRGMNGSDYQQLPIDQDHFLHHKLVSYRQCWSGGRKVVIDWENQGNHLLGVAVAMILIQESEKIHQLEEKNLIIEEWSSPFFFQAKSIRESLFSYYRQRNVDWETSIMLSLDFSCFQSHTSNAHNLAFHLPCKLRKREKRTLNQWLCVFYSHI